MPRASLLATWRLYRLLSTHRYRGWVACCWLVIGACHEDSSAQPHEENSASSTDDASSQTTTVGSSTDAQTSEHSSALTSSFDDTSSVTSSSASDTTSDTSPDTLDPHVVDVAAGERHTCALLRQGRVTCWGNNEFGQLGFGDSAQRGDGPREMGKRLSTLDLGADLSATQIVAGLHHTCARFDNGTVKCWGRNDQGQLGLGDTDRRGDHWQEMGDALPTVALGQTVKSLSAGSRHTCALLDDGSVKCWGFNASGQLGLGDRLHRGEQPNEMGDALPSVDLGDGAAAVALAAGANHTCALLADGQVQCWGDNRFGQLGHGDTLNRGDEPNEMGVHLDVSVFGLHAQTVGLWAGGDHTCATFDDGRSACWGKNDHGQLGLGDRVDRGGSPDHMGVHLATHALGQGRHAKAMATGLQHTCAILDNGAIKCWGTNGRGQLGLGDTRDRGGAQDDLGDRLPALRVATASFPLALRTGAHHTCALLESGALQCWGVNDYGQLGLEDTNHRGDVLEEMGAQLPAVNLQLGRRVKAISAGLTHNCARFENDTVKCWGFNLYGQLGTGQPYVLGDNPNEMGDRLPFLRLGSDPVHSVVAGGAHTCALFKEGRVKCWGINEYGQLGLGDTTNRGRSPGEMGDALPYVDVAPGKHVTELALGTRHTCAVLDDASVKCWGRNSTGELGSGTQESLGDDVNEMGDNLPTVGLGKSKLARAIDLRHAHTCALLVDNSVKCWGENDVGQLGLGDTNARGDEANEMGEWLLPTQLSSHRTVSALAIGYSHSCALLNDHSVKCWGGYSSDWAGGGGLGTGDKNSRGDEPDEMGDALPVVDTGSTHKIVALSTGWHHSCVLLENGSVKCWGDSFSGQLGLGDQHTRGDEPGEMGEQLPEVSLGEGQRAIALECGAVHTCVILADGLVKCWGSNSTGRLGQGHTWHIGDQVNTMGDNLPAIEL